MGQQVLPHFYWVFPVTHGKRDIPFLFCTMTLKVLF